MTYWVIKTGSCALSLHHSLSHQVLNYSPTLNLKMAPFILANFLLKVNGQMVQMERHEASSDRCFYCLMVHPESNAATRVTIPRQMREFIHPDSGIYFHVTYKTVDGEEHIAKGFTNSVLRKIFELPEETTKALIVVSLYESIDLSCPWN